MCSWHSLAELGSSSSTNLLPPSSDLLQPTWRLGKSQVKKSLLKKKNSGAHGSWKTLCLFCAGTWCMFEINQENSISLSALECPGVLLWEHHLSKCCVLQSAASVLLKIWLIITWTRKLWDLHGLLALLENYKLKLLVLSQWEDHKTHELEDCGKRTWSNLGSWRHTEKKGFGQKSDRIVWSRCSLG